MANHNVTWDEARQIAYAAVSHGATEVVSLADAVGRTTAEALIAKADLPPAHTAMMDGYAVAGAGPWHIGHEVRAGQYVAEIEPGQALKVMTGAHIPASCSFVIPNEDAIVFESDVASQAPIPMGKHIRIPGDEAKTGDEIISAGSLITPVVAGLAASSSIDEITVVATPSVDLLVTGDELISEGLAKPGSIRDSISIQMPHWVTKLGGNVGQLARVLDDLAVTRKAIEDCTSPIIVTTGGTAHSDHDYVRKALVELEAEFLIDEIKMRPGHPSILAKLPSGQLVASLPGNPLAAVATFLTLVGPMLNAYLGQPLPELGTAELKEPFPAEQTRVTPIVFENGRVVPTGFRGSAMLRGLSSASSFAVIDPGKNEPGTKVRLIPLPW